MRSSMTKGIEQYGGRLTVAEKTLDEIEFSGIGRALRLDCTPVDRRLTSLVSIL